MGIETLAAEIVTLEEPSSVQEGIPWRPEAWQKSLSGSPESLNAIEEVKSASVLSEGTMRINRNGVSSVAASGNPLGTFIAYQVWGHGTNGYGPFRVAIALGLDEGRGARRTTFARTVEYLGEAQSICQREGGVEAYRFLVNKGKLPQLGPAFLTKYLYFIPDSASPKPLVLDALVKKTIEKFARDSFTSRFGRTDYYGEYLALVDGVVSCLAQNYQREFTTGDVEYALFRLGKRR